MGLQERAYYAMIEFRSAIQDYVPSSTIRKNAKNYLNALSICLKAGKEGYSHEMLFAAHLCVKTGAFNKAGQLFADAAEQLENEPRLAREAFELACKCYERLGNRRTAAKLRPV
jgi:hypothetical protein